MTDSKIFPVQSLRAALVFLLLSSLPGFAAQNTVRDPEETPNISSLKPWPLPPTPPGVILETNISYLPENRQEKADIYRPREIPAGNRIPAVIIIHGGGFNDGDKARKREFNIGTNLAVNGYLGMSINYRLAKTKGISTWPQCLCDAKTAVRWLRTHAEQLKIDPERIGVIGGSAGGNLAAMLALTRPQDGLEPTEPYPGVSTRVSCAVDLYGAVDLMNYHDMKMFAKTRDEAPELYKKASPTSYVWKEAPPLLIVHGDADAVVNVSQSLTLAEALKKAGASHELVIVAGAPHTFDLEPKQKDLRPLVLGFLDRHLKSTKAPQP